MYLPRVQILEAGKPVGHASDVNIRFWSDGATVTIHDFPAETINWIRSRTGHKHNGIELVDPETNLRYKLDGVEIAAYAKTGSEATLACDKSNPPIKHFWQDAFSNWAKQSFQIGGVTYNCGEQWMMASKARLFGDKDAETKIMASTDPKEQKALGRKVRGFVESVWIKYDQEIVYLGTLARALQCPEFSGVLAPTKGYLLAEASPYDHTWGIGLGAKDPRAAIVAEWRGLNKLGYVQTQMRSDLEHKRELAFAKAAKIHHLLMEKLDPPRHHVWDLPPELEPVYLKELKTMHNVKLIHELLHYRDVDLGETGMDIETTPAGEYPKIPKRITTENVDRHIRKANDCYHDKQEVVHEELVGKIAEYIQGDRLPVDIWHCETGEVIAPAGRALTKSFIVKIARAYDKLEIDPSPLRVRLNQIIQPFEKRFEALITERDCHLALINHKLNPGPAGKLFDGPTELNNRASATSLIAAATTEQQTLPSPKPESTRPGRITVPVTEEPSF